MTPGGSDYGVVAPYVCVNVRACVCVCTFRNVDLQAEVKAVQSGECCPLGCRSFDLGQVQQTCWTQNDPTAADVVTPRVARLLGGKLAQYNQSVSRSGGGGDRACVSVTRVAVKTKVPGTELTTIRPAACQPFVL